MRATNVAVADLFGVRPDGNYSAHSSQAIEDGFAADAETIGPV